MNIKSIIYVKLIFIIIFINGCTTQVKKTNGLYIQQNKLGNTNKREKPSGQQDYVESINKRTIEKKESAPREYSCKEISKDS